jgi:hypothetical protein
MEPFVFAKNKNTCSAVISASCVLWPGYKLESFDYTNVQCVLQVDDIILSIDKLLNKINKAISTNDLTRQCLIVEDTEKLNSYVKSLVSNYCQLKEDFDTLKEDFDNLDVFQKVLNIDLSCILGQYNCTPGNEHKLSFILSTLAKEICSLKTQIN